MRLLFTTFLTLLFFSCTSPNPESAEVQDQKEASNTVFPGKMWLRARTQGQGIDSSSLTAALAYLEGHSKADGLSEVMIIRNGYLVWSGDSIDKVHDIWSCTKSFTSTAVGLMQEEGILDLDQPVADHEPRLKELYPEATYRHFLTMTSGYNAAGSTRWPTDVSEDWSWTPYEPTTPLFAPGTEYTYWDEAMIMLGRALTQAAGKNLNDYLKPRLFDKIGIEQRDWWGEGKVTADSIPINFGGTGLVMSAQEQARLGLLYLNDGMWKGERVLPKGWAGEAMSVQVGSDIKLADTDRKSANGIDAYGYNWWVINEPVHAAFTSGLNHNVCLVVPEWDMVIVRMGVDGNPALSKLEVYGEFLRLLSGGIS